LYIIYIAPIVSPSHPLPTTLKAIARGFFVLFHMHMQSPSWGFSSWPVSLIAFGHLVRQHIMVGAHGGELLTSHSQEANWREEEGLESPNPLQGHTCNGLTSFCRKGTPPKGSTTSIKWAQLLSLLERGCWEVLQAQGTATDKVGWVQQSEWEGILSLHDQDVQFSVTFTVHMWPVMASLRLSYSLYVPVFLPSQHPPHLLHTPWLVSSLGSPACISSVHLQINEFPCHQWLQLYLPLSPVLFIE
jgi:hypothetical protein